MFRNYTYIQKKLVIGYWCLVGRQEYSFFPSSNFSWKLFKIKIQGREKVFIENTHNIFAYFLLALFFSVNICILGNTVRMRWFGGQKSTCCWPWHPKFNAHMVKKKTDSLDCSVTSTQVPTNRQMDTCMHTHTHTHACEHTHTLNKQM